MNNSTVAGLMIVVFIGAWGMAWRCYYESEASANSYELVAVQADEHSRDIRSLVAEIMKDGKMTRTEYEHVQRVVGYIKHDASVAKLKAAIETNQGLRR